ncbi:MAG: GxxExxY protein [Planctomycetaceae bacterium]
MNNKLLHCDLTDKIIGTFYDVYNALGFGFLEKVYENSLVVALTRQGLTVAQQDPISVYYDGAHVGTYFADIIVNQLVIIEVKVSESLHTTHEAQLLNYLKATQIEVGLLLNFGEKPDFRRKAFSNERKRHVKH